MIPSGLGLLARGRKDSERRAEDMGKNYSVDLSVLGWILQILNNKIQVRVIGTKM